MNKIHRFQGGGHYDENGQVIIAQLQDDGRIAFVDFARNIDGFIPASEYPVTDIPGRVCSMYIRNQYEQAANSAEGQILFDMIDAHRTAKGR